ncbi:Mu transposase C-terminal domain-containing protein [Sulfitobacter sp. EhC04]|uniref:Mu transposase C-terminal domain-containing protein n=1 Tax=Sulfitobacter sp. EhC04 TaxID=1849168 RepID=UPI000B021360|nr:Mu transposase C-terminal domain-containing protein [Sulfitobacter sp. EhC04]
MVSERLAKHRASVLRPILELEKKGEPISAAIGDAAWELGLAKSHTWSLYRRLRENDGRATALELGRRGPQLGSKRIAREVEHLIDASLRRYYLVRERPSFLRIWREIRSECEAKGFQPPTRKTVKARLDAMDEKEIVRKRRGAKEANKTFAARPGRLAVGTPLDIVQIDHTMADIILVDYMDRRPLARPYLTVAIDVATRIVLGVFVSFDAPSVLSIALCLDHCVRRKSIHVPGTLEELVWPTSGIPKAIHVDNAQEFHSEAFSSACEDWGIAVEYRPPGATHFGGHIERLIGTAMGAVHVLPGTTQSSAAEKGDYDSGKHAALTLAEFEEWLDLEICRYHNTRHEALGRTPLAAWADLGGDTAGRQVIDVEAFRTSFLPFEWRQVGRTGITLFGVHYWSDVFASLVGRGQGKVQVKYDPRDLSQVWVLVDDGRMIPARYRDLSHPRISLWESRRARKEWQDRHVGRINEKALFQVIDAQRRLAEAAREKTRTARLESERATRLPKQKPHRDPSREMFAIDTGNPDLPTYPIEEFDDPRRKN